MTLVRDAKEGALLRESLQVLAELRIPVYITDGGSPRDFIEFLHQFPHFILSDAPAKGLFPQIANSLRRAYEKGTDLILYSEPDKKYFFRGIDEFFVKAQPDSGVFLASRADAGFASYPAFQQMTETCINNCCAEVTGAAFDYTYGPFLLQRELVPCLDLVPDDCGWGWRPFLFCMAHRLGLTLKEHRGEYFCPAEQQDDDAAERLYRMKQMVQSVNGAILSGTVQY